MDKEMKKIQNKLRNMKNTDLREKIIQINRDQLIDIEYLAFFEVFEKFIQLKHIYKRNSEFIDSLGSEAKEILSLFERIEDRVNNIEIVMGHEIIDNSLKVDFYRNLRKDAFGLVTGITGYLTEISYTNEIANYYRMKEKYKMKDGFDNTKTNLERFYKDIYEFLVEDEKTINEKISRIVSILPVRITKQRFFDIVKESIIRDLKEDSKEKVDIILNRYKSIFNGALEIEYGSKFDSLFSKAQESRLFNFKNESIDMINQMYDKTTDYIGDIYNVINVLTQCGIITNRFIMISMVKNYKEKREFSNNITSIIEKWKAFNNEPDERLEEEILEICKSNKKDITDKIKNSNIYLEALSKEYFKRGIAIDKELKEILINTRNILAYLNDFYLENEEILIVKEEQTIDPIYLEQAVDNLIQYLDRNIKHMSNIQRKVRMRRILSVIKNPFTRIEDFFVYLRNCMDYNASPEDIELVFDRVNQIMEEYEWKN